jgi:hypothetical protein
VDVADLLMEDEADIEAKRAARIAHRLLPISARRSRRAADDPRSAGMGVPRG